MVTAVITTHCRESDIVSRALESVMDQTYEDMEIILVDDSPSSYEKRDEIKSLAEQARKKVTYIPHEKCMGACAARNTGISHAKGEYIAFLDDDDEWLPTKIEKQIEMFSSKEVGFVYCRYKVIDTVNNTARTSKKQIERGNIFKYLICENMVGSTSFPLIRKSALEEIGGFDTELQSAQDLDVWLRISEKYDAEYVDEELGIYYFHSSDQITSNPKKKISGLERIIDKNIEYLRSHPDAYANRLLVMSPYYSLDGRLSDAIKKWASAVRLKPMNIKKNFRTLLVVIKWRLLSKA